MSQIDLYQGDCLEVMQQLIDKGIKVDAVMVDPPYEILNKKCKWDKMIDISSMWNCLNLLTDKTSPMLLFAQEPYASYLISSMIILSINGIGRKLKQQVFLMLKNNH